MPMIGREYARWDPFADAPECRRCGCQHGDETESDRCAQIHEGEAWCEECGKELTLERAKRDVWECAACEEEFKKC